MCKSGVWGFEWTLVAICQPAGNAEQIKPINVRGNLLVAGRRWEIHQETYRFSQNYRSKITLSREQNLRQFSSLLHLIFWLKKKKKKKKNNERRNCILRISVFAENNGSSFRISRAPHATSVSARADHKLFRSKLLTSRFRPHLPCTETAIFDSRQITAHAAVMFRDPSVCSITSNKIFEIQCSYR